MRLPRSHAFTMVEMLVVIFILLILLSIFVPYGMHLREQSRRVECADNLREIFGALTHYARDNASMFPRTIYDPQKVAEGYAAFTGADATDPFAQDTRVHPNDVTAAYWLLLRIGYLTDVKVFICAGGSQWPELVKDPKTRGNFASAKHLSYSFATPYSSNPEYRLTSDLPAEFVLAADLNPGGDPGVTPHYKSEGNSNNHRGAGQNVLYAYGEVKFQPVPDCAINGDNIYTLRDRPATAPAVATAPTTDPSTRPTSIDFSPMDTADVYLVPKATD